jgi:hypothetical protein
LSKLVQILTNIVCSVKQILPSLLTKHPDKSRINQILKAPEFADNKQFQKEALFAGHPEFVEGLKQSG